MNISAFQALEIMERLHAYDSVSAPVLEEEVDYWIGTSLSIAGVPLLIHEGELEEVIETPGHTPIPGTKPWVLGVAAFKGSLLPILSGDVLFRRKPYTGSVRDYCMVVKRSGMYFGLTLSDIKSDLRFTADDFIPKHEVDRDFAEFTDGGFQYNGEYLAILDINKLVAYEELQNASATGITFIRGNSDE